MVSRLTQKQLKEVLEYDPATGLWRWRRKRGCRAAGQIAGCVKDDQDGWPYVVIRVNGHLYYAHRLAFLYMADAYPTRADHENGNTLDNRWGNLRPATNSQNAMNSKIAIHNTSGHKGVSWSNGANKWRARIKIDCREIHLGLFNDIDDAAKAYREKATELFGAFSRSS